ncbi:MAG TPA: hypothetical protein VLX85_06665 [Stellaceae bacterium]|nr:hypothetical protein [Stellaceae bacterium]
MKRFALAVAALLLCSVLAAGSAQAGRMMHSSGFRSFGFHHGFVGFHHRFIGFNHPFFFRHEFFFHRGLFRPFFFFGRPAFAPILVALDPPYDYPGYLYDQAGDQGNCYEYESMIAMYGAPTPAWGTACMQPDGTWLTVE